MPASNIGFLLKPDGFFARNPAMDLPPPTWGTDEASRRMRYVLKRFPVWYYGVFGGRGAPGRT